MISPSVARADSFYASLEGGVLRANKHNGNALIDYTTTIVTGFSPNVPNDASLDVRGKQKHGFDAALVGGYDFGPFRAEVELGRKRSVEIRSLSEADIDDLNVNLARGPVFTGQVPLPLLTTGDFAGRRTLKINSAMLNALVDVPVAERATLYLGAGLGWASVRALEMKEQAAAYQLIAGGRYALNDTVEIGLKYRYFVTDAVPGFDEVRLAGNNILAPFQKTSFRNDAILRQDAHHKLRSHSILASVTFNWGTIH